MRALVFATFLLCAGVSYAQDTPITFPPAPSDPDKRAAMAEDYFNQAEALYRVQEYSNAYLYYKQSYLLSPQPALLFNMGQCYRQMGKLEEALKSYKSFIRDDPNNSLRSQVEQLITEVEEQIKQKNGSNPNPNPDKDKDLKTDTDQDSIVDANDLCVTEKEDGKGKAPKDGCPEPAVEASPSTKDNGPKLNPTAKYLYFGAGGGAAVGTAMGIIAFSQASTAKKEQQKSTPDVAAADAAFGKAKTFAFISDAAFVAAIGAGAAGFFIQQKSKKQPEVTVSVAPNGASLMVRF